MSTPAQQTANEANAQLSTGPKTEAGKASSAANNFRHGLIGSFRVLTAEEPHQYMFLLQELTREHKPAGPTEHLLVERMAQHHWLSDRAIRFQNNLLDAPEYSLSQFALYLRYQTTHERAFHKCLADLLKLKAEKRKQEIGFEQQKRKEAEEARKQELHQARLRALNAKTTNQEFENELRQTNGVKTLSTSSLCEVARTLEAKLAA